MKNENIEEKGDVEPVVISNDEKKGKIKESVVIDEKLISSTRNLEIGGEVHLKIDDLDLWYGEKQALFDVSLPISKNNVTAF